MSSLVCSTLILNSHFRVLSPSEISIPNGPFMRAVRKIGGNERYGKPTCDDRSAREQVEIVSIDCEMLRNRLTYFFTFASQRAVSTFIAFVFSHCQW